jgi:transcriptional regulator with XRE-family HTH domain
LEIEKPCGNFAPHKEQKTENRKKVKEPIKKTTAMKTLGIFIKDVRIKKEISLREFCRKTMQDPSNWSKIERGQIHPPRSKEILEKIAETLTLEPGSEEYNTLFDLALITFIPRELVKDEEIINYLPVFFRTVRGDPPTDDELRELFNLIRNHEQQIDT